MISHRERLQACLNGEQTDRAPVALWRHFPVDDQNPEALAAAHLAFQQTYDFDLIKVTPASSYCLKDWGAEDVWEGNPEGTRRYTRHVIHQPEDWEKLRLLDPTAPHLSAQLVCLKEIKRLAGQDTPILQTIFNPLSQAKNLAGNDTLILHLRRYPEAVMQGLETISRTTQKYVQAVLETGVDGIFYAVQHAQATLLTLEEFQRFSRASDLAILEQANDRWCNLLHLHGENVYFEQVADYPGIQIINWHDQETPPSLMEARQKYEGVLCGGLSRETLVFKTPGEIRAEAREALKQTRGQRFILSTGCVVPIIAPHGNWLAARRAIEAK